jgi:hypothetical protein
MVELILILLLWGQLEFMTVECSHVVAFHARAITTLENMDASKSDQTSKKKIQIVRDFVEKGSHDQFIRLRNLCLNKRVSQGGAQAMLVDMENWERTTWTMRSRY